MTAPNVQPQFTNKANVQSVLFGGAALTTSDGSSGTVGTNIFVAFTPGANDSYVEFLRIMGVASAAATATAPTTARIYISTVNSGSTTTSNTWLFNEIALPAITADQTTTATNYYDCSFGLRLPSTCYILISSHIINNSNTSLRATTFGGDY